MTPSHWLAVLVLGWIVVAGLWQAIDKPLERYYKSYFYLLCTTCVELATLFAALIVLGAGTGWMIFAGMFAFVAVSGVFMLIRRGDRTL